MATATKNDSAKTYECCIAFCSPWGDAQEGLILRANDPRVLNVPQYFCEAGAPQAERPTVFDHAVAVNDQRSRELEEAKREAWEHRAKANALKIEAPTLVTARRDVVGEFEGAPTTVKKGSKLSAGHPFVLEHEDSFA